MTLPNDLARDRAVERWLGGQVGPAYDALKADTSRAETAERIRARLTREHQNAKFGKGNAGGAPSCECVNGGRRKVSDRNLKQWHRFTHSLGQ